MVETFYHASPILSPVLSERKLRLALLTDFHNGEPKPVLHSLEKQRPDFICIAGDLVRGRAPEGDRLFDEQKNVLPFLHGCLNTAPTFMSLGNHENVLSDEDVEIIKGTGVILLDNEWIQWNGLAIGGLTSHQVLDHRAFREAHPSNERYPHYRHDPEWITKKEPDTSWLNTPVSGYKILLSHHPEYYPLIPRNIDLIVSGHAHGGQVRFFGRGLYAPGQGWFPKYTSGVYDGRLVVSRGLTNSARVPRVNNPPEVVYVQ